MFDMHFEQMFEVEHSWQFYIWHVMHLSDTELYSWLDEHLQVLLEMIILLRHCVHTFVELQRPQLGSKLQ